MDILNRPDWDDYFIALAFLSSTRSLDPSTKHGCVITDRHRRIQSIGFNGPPRGMDDTKVPLTRPDKYPYMIHAEENAILSSNTSLDGSIAYITGHPCHKCFRMLIQKGVAKIVYGPITFQGVEEDQKIVRGMIRKMKTPVKMIRHTGDAHSLLDSAGDLVRGAQQLEIAFALDKPRTAKKQRKVKPKATAPRKKRGRKDLDWVRLYR
jgi:dCMP deaminase